MSLILSVLTGPYSHSGGNESVGWLEKMSQRSEHSPVSAHVTLPRNASIQNGRRRGQKQRHLLMSMLCHYHSTFSKIMSCTATLEQTKKNELKFGETCIIFLVVKSKKRGRICYLCLYVNYGDTETKVKSSAFFTLYVMYYINGTQCAKGIR